MTTLETVTLVTAFIGAGCGLLGAVLGIINTWTQLSRNRVRLRVVPRIGFQTSHNGLGITCDRIDPGDEKRLFRYPARLCIEVVNLSTFPVTIHDVGFGNPKKLRHCLVQPETSPQRSWPVRLESREGVTAFGAVGAVQLDAKIIRNAKAYARTDCGKTCYGTSPFFRQYAQQLMMKVASDGEHE